MTDRSDAHRVAERLAALVRVPTVTPSDEGPLDEQAAATFAELQTLLRSWYPSTFAASTIDEVGRAGLLLRIAGASSERPVVLMAHQDVVPVGDDDGWTYPPFDGVIADGMVYGRGTLDDKGALVVLMEAVEQLLVDGWSPSQDLYLSLGADEESMGASAVAAVDVLRDRGVEPYLVLDEGGAVTSGMFPGLDVPVAVVGVSEKGVATFVLEVSGAGGHASMPPARTAAGILARAMLRVEDHPAPAAMHDVSVEMFEALAPHMEGPMGVVASRARVLRPVLAQVLPRLGGPALAAMVRTTMAITQLEGSPGHNVLATRARATVNCRIAIGSTIEETRRHLVDVIGDEQVTVALVEGSDPSPVSPTGDDPRWSAISDAARVAFPDAVTVPYIMMAASDGRHFAAIAPAVYRFSPLRMTAEQVGSIHGIDERVAVRTLGEGVAFYRALITTVC